MRGCDAAGGLVGKHGGHGAAVRVIAVAVDVDVGVCDHGCVGGGVGLGEGARTREHDERDGETLKGDKT
jgi:hypothetical protein